MELLVYTKLFREKFQKESFLCENDLLLVVHSGAFKVRIGDTWVRTEENQAFHFFKNKRYERRILSPLTMSLFRYESKKALFPTEHLVFRDTARVRSTVALCEGCASLPDAAARRAHYLSDLALQYEAERISHLQREDRAMLYAEKRMNEMLSEEISIPALAKECALSNVQFIRRFRKAFERTPSAHIALLRLDRAKGLLAETDLPIKQIARCCGFENEFYFSSFFKKHTALSPSAYRTMIG